MKKLPYITILTALALLFRLYAVYTYKPILLLIWAAGLALLFAGELIGIRVGKDFRYSPNIGAAVPSALILTLSIFLAVIAVRVYPPDYVGTMWNSIYNIIGIIAVGSLLINLGSVAAKRILIWREHHGALPDEKLTLRAFCAHFIVTAVLNILLVAVYYVMLIFFPDAVFSGVLWFPFGVVNIAIAAETANMVGIFFDRLLETRIINNILIAARGTVDIIGYINSLYRASLNNNVRYRSFYRLMIAVWAAVIIAAAVWAVIKLRRQPKSPLSDDL